MTAPLALLPPKRQTSNSSLIGTLTSTASREAAEIFTNATRAAFSLQTLPGSSFAAPAHSNQQSAPAARSIEEQLYDAKAAFKIMVNQRAMHFGGDWQQRFFKQLDAILNAEDWDEADQLLTQSSFATLIKILLILRGKKRPGLGVGANGNVIAAWTNGANRLTLECRPDDAVNWIVTQIVDGEPDTAAGRTSIAHLLERLASYNPEQWFSNEASKPTA